MTTRQELVAALDAANAAQAAAAAAVSAFDDAPENNRFDDLEKAESVIEDKLLGIASLDCEGSYNCGQPEYRQGFYVGDVKYVGILTVEYNRHDKTYYYVEESDFTVEQAPA